MMLVLNLTMDTDVIDQRTSLNKNMLALRDTGGLLAVGKLRIPIDR